MKRLWLSLAVGALTAAGCASVADEPEQQPPPSQGQGQPTLSAAVMAQMDQLIAEKAARTPVQRKISSYLLYQNTGRFAATTGTAKDPAKQLVDMQQIDGQGRMMLDLRGDMSAISAQIASLGGSIVEARQRSARVWLDVSRVEALAASPAIKSVRPAFQAMTWTTDPPGGAKFRLGSRAERVAAAQAATAAWAESHPAASSSPPPTTGPATTQAGSVTSEGDKAQQADRARRFYGINGTGVNVGVLSDSDDFKESSIASGDLPPDTTTLPGQSGRPGTGEGTSMMEIVHDLAPGAKLFFATAFTSAESFADNIRALRFQAHCDIIIDDVVYFLENPFQDDIIAQAVDDITADGGMYFSSAGNEGNFDDGSTGTWEGDFKAAGTLATLPSGYTVHQFGNNVIDDRVEVGGGPLMLHWSDPGTMDNPAASNDYDVFVLDEDMRNVLFSSTDIQDGTGLPSEFVGFFISAGQRVVIAANPGAQPRAVRLELIGGELALSTPGSTWGHNSTADGFGVAAVDAAEAVNGVFTGGPTTPIEVFSSDGPRRIFFDRDNTPINGDRPGLTFASGGGVTRSKPDLAAADGVSTNTPLNPFFGTSAAAPHAGAVAALIKSAVPTATAATIRAALLNGAIDIGPVGADRDSGRGVVSAFNSLGRAGARAAVSLGLGTVRPVPLGSDAILPGGAAQLAVDIANAGGAPATAVSAVLTSSSPNVLILSNSSSYPTVNGESSSTNSSLFAFFVDLNTPCGALLPFTLTVNYTGNGPKPVVLSFTVQVGRIGAPSRVSFTGPPVAIPDANLTGASALLSVGGVTSPIAKLVFSIDGAACTSNAGATTVGVDHTWVGDLTFTLTSPGGKSVKLFDRPGGPFNSDNNFCQTVLDDAAATSIQNVVVGQAPFTGTFAPQQPLSTFIGDSANGTWTLHAVDNVGGDIGSIRAFSLGFSGFSCSR